MRFAWSVLWCLIFSFILHHAQGGVWRLEISSSWATLFVKVDACNNTVYFCAYTHECCPSVGSVQLHVYVYLGFNHQLEADMVWTKFSRTIWMMFDCWIALGLCDIMDYSVFTASTMLKSRIRTSLASLLARSDLANEISNWRRNKEKRNFLSKTSLLHFSQHYIHASIRNCLTSARLGCITNLYFGWKTCTLGGDPE